MFSMFWRIISEQTVFYYHVTYAFQSESTLYSYLNVKELPARNRPQFGLWLSVRLRKSGGFKSRCCHLNFLTVVLDETCSITADTLNIVVYQYNCRWPILLIAQIMFLRWSVVLLLLLLFYFCFTVALPSKPGTRCWRS